MKHVFVRLDNGKVTSEPVYIAACVFADGIVTMTCVDEYGNSQTIQAPREVAVTALRDLADQIEKAVP